MDLTATLIQTNLHWEDKNANLAMLEEKIAQVEDSDLIVLPEMFTTGFSMRPADFAEPMGGESTRWMQAQAHKSGAALAGSLIVEEAGRFYNRFIWVEPDGELRYYDKRHLFAMAGEHNYYTAGERKIIIEYKGWRICPFVCYDLRFPVWNRNRENYDLALYVANWPDRRALHWRSLLLARAIENQCFVLGVNRVGNDGNGIYHSGHSSVISASGEILYQNPEQEAIKTIALSRQQLEEIRAKLPFLQDADDFELRF